MIVQPDASRRTLVERRSPSAPALLDAELDPLLDERTETELLDELEPCERDAADAPFPSASTRVSITRPSAV